MTARLHVQDDLKEFRSPDGALITSRTKWREHLKRTGTVEMSHSDIKAGTEKWNKRKRDFAEKISRNQPLSREVPVMESRGHDSRLNAEMANKLYNRPAPSRTELLKLTMETAADLQRRK